LQSHPAARGFSCKAGDTLMQGNDQALRIIVPGFPPLNCTMDR
jgi:hypothetical protein